MREIILDTETTGTDPFKGDRIIEIGCVELINHIPTGKTFHAYLNPQYPVSEGAFRVHGLSNTFLSDKPLFAEIVEPFLVFIEEARLVIHNAPFDLGFLDGELSRLNRPKIRPERVLDTLVLARRKHPGASNSLDALCMRYGIDNSKRSLHGALLDAHILSEVYIELIGGKQTALGLDTRIAPQKVEPALGMSQTSSHATPLSPRARSLMFRLTPEERQRHQAMIETLGAKSIWKRYRAS
jgi:DNA polymerase III subunit epsilon